MTPIRVLIVDDHEMVLAGLQVLLEPLPSIEVIGSVGTGAAALHFVRHVAVPDVVLLDISLPDVNGIDLCQQLLGAGPGLRVLGLSTFNDRAFITGLLQQGASGYVLKNATLAELAEAITKVHSGEKYLSEEALGMLVQDVAPPPSSQGPTLTRREKEILLLIADGCTNQVIAQKLFVSPLTVDTHRRNLFTKFGVNNAAALIKLAAKYQLV